jgi:hypothetical protein
MPGQVPEGVDLLPDGLVRELSAHLHSAHKRAFTLEPSTGATGGPTLSGREPEGTCNGTARAACRRGPRAHIAHEEGYLTSSDRGSTVPRSQPNSLAALSLSATGSRVPAMPSIPTDDCPSS